MGLGHSGGWFRALVAIIPIALGACATPAQQKAAAILQNTLAATTALKACVAAVDADPRFASVMLHVPADVREATLEQLTDDTYPSKSDIRLIYQMHPKLQACRGAALTQLSQTTPSIVPIMSDEMIVSENALIDLVQHKLTWGDYVRKVRDAYQAVQPKVVAEFQRIQSGLEQENQYELSQRQAALEALARYYQNQQAINALNHPVVSNCITNGSVYGNNYASTTNCTSN